MYFFFASLSFLWYTFCGCLFATILHKPATRSIPNAPIHVCVCVLHMCGIFFSAFLCSFFRVILLRLCSLFSYVRPITNWFWRVGHTFERVLQKTLNSPIRNCFKQWLWKSYFDEKIILRPCHIYIYIFIHMQQAWHILSWIFAIYRQIALHGSCRLCNHNYYWF